MPNNRDITITISADGSAAIAGIRSVGDETEKMGNKTGSFLNQAKQNWVAYSAVIYAALKSVEAAWRLADNAMKIDAQLQMLDRLSTKYQTTGTQIAKSLQAAANGVISMDEAIGLATKGIFSGLDPDQMVRLMSITGAAARANGITVAEAYEKIAQAAETGRSRGLRQMGIIVDLEKAHAAYAARLNTTAKELTEEEKQVASVNAILERQAKIMDELGPAQENMRTKVLQLKSAWADLKDQIGGVLVQLASGAFSALDRIAESFGKSLAQTDHVGGASGSWGDSKTPAGPAGNIRENVRLNDFMRRLAEERDLIDAAEKDKALFRLNIWFEEQQKKLRELGAGNEAFSALVAAYAAKRHADITSWANKTSDFYLEVQRANVKENDEIEKERSRRLYEEQERGVRERLAIQDAYAKAGDTETESDAIRRKAAGEREILAIRQEALVASITEQTTFAETLKIMTEYAVLQNQIEASKRVEVMDLDVRQLAIKRELLQLQLKLADAALKAGGQNTGSIPGMSDLFTSMNSFVDAYSNLKLGTGPWDAWATSVEAKHDRIAESYRNGLATMDEYDAAFKDAVRAREQADWMMRVQVAGAAMGMMANMATSLYMLQGQQGGAAFEMMKAFRIGETIINTYSAAVGAYNAMASIPYVGPALGAAAAAAAIAFGMAQVNAIRSMKPGGGASVSAGGGGGVPSLAASGSATSAPAAESKPTPIINVHIYNSGYIGADGDALAREIAPRITKALADGVR